MFFQASLLFLSHGAALKAAQGRFTLHRAQDSLDFLNGQVKALAILFLALLVPAPAITVLLIFPASVICPAVELAACGRVLGLGA
jgi:hypothetical protein